jgi:hypothetical protein
VSGIDCKERTLGEDQYIARPWQYVADLLDALTAAFREAAGTREGLEPSLGWAQDTFAYAEAYDEASARYRGLGGEYATVLIDPMSVVVKPDVARRQLDASDDDEGDGGNGTHIDEGGSGEEVVVRRERTVRRFFAVKSLDPQRVSRDADQIATEVITHLVGLVGAEVVVEIEISAEVPSGVPDDVVRTITENARTLKFEQHGFEAS